MSAVAAIAETESSRLDKLANAANHEHELCFKAAMTMLYHGIAAGEALNEAKSLVPRGSWATWLAENVSFRQTTAASFMLVARHKDYLLSCKDVTTMQAALEELRRQKLTTQTRIDDERIALIRERAAAIGVSAAARELGESFGTVQRYASGKAKLKRVKPANSGTQRRIGITDEMIERLAAWMARKLWKDERAVTDALRDLALEALRTALAPGEE